MLTHEAMEERRWGGLSNLRLVLGAARRDHEGRLYPTSVTESDFDRIRNSIYLGALAVDHRKTLLAAIETEKDENDRERLREGLLQDLAALEDTLRWIEQAVTERRAEIGDMMSALWKTAR
jgi:hypothetical protein